MRRLIMFLVMAPLVVLTIPATAQTPVACPEPSAGTTVIGPNQQKHPTVAAPIQPIDPILTGEGGRVNVKYQLDLSPATAANKASLGIYLDWTIETSDWDLRVYNASGGLIGSSTNSQPATIGPGGWLPQLTGSHEKVFFASMLHCTEFRIEIENFAALGGPIGDQVDPLKLKVESGFVR